MAYAANLGRGDIVYPGLIAAWSAKGKSNDDEDREVLKDLTGNEHDISLNGFAFNTEGSGYNNPLYPDALVFDGVDDSTQAIELPSNNITVISKYRTLTIWNNYGSFTNYFRKKASSPDEFIRMRDLSDNDEKINYYAIEDFKLVSYSSVVEFSKLSKQVSDFYLVGFDKQELSSVAWYSTYIFDRVLDEQEIKAFIRKYIDPDYVLPSEQPT